ncbi:MAG: type 1 glutamine amidotransferase [Candidatus Nanopelagicales bacterium]
MRAVVVAHTWIAHELGHLGDWLGARGSAVQRLDRESLPTPESLDGADLLVLMGSPWSVALPADADVVESQRRERDLVARALSDGTPLLGICYGAQLLASCVGGEVRRLDVTERGWLDVDAVDPVPTGPWMVWHEDEFTVPPAVEVLASSPRCTLAFRTGTAWGVQFHPEVDEPVLRRMAEGLGAAPDVVAEMTSGARLHDAGHRQAAHHLLDAFWSDVRA